MEVTPTNVALNKRKLDEKPLVIVYNSGKIQNELDENIEQFLEKAKEKQADIWPVAFSKEAREPVDNISKKQSYDIWEQLRCRGLDKIHISAIAKAFSRKIIARELPTLYNNCGEVFISHRRIDGEEIAALIYDKIKIQEEKLKIFRDVAKVNVGDEAQTEIDEVMKNSEIFIFIHTGKAAESDWILKELRFALLRNIPILWVQIDGADVKKLRIKPSDQPHLSYSSEDFEKEETLTEIIDEILQKAFELIMLNSNKIFDYSTFRTGQEAFSMSSITTAVAVDYRLQQWAQLVKDCQNRPQDMTVEQWCDTKGISKSNYYYRLRCIRKACLEHVQDNSVSCQQVVEIPEKITQQSRSESPSDISIEINGVVIHIKEDISESLLEKIIRVVSRAK